MRDRDILLPLVDGPGDSVRMLTHDGSVPMVDCRPLRLEEESFHETIFIALCDLRGGGRGGTL